jgi:hypothetical protein
VCGLVAGACCVQVAAGTELAWTATGIIPGTPQAASAAAPAITIRLTFMLASLDSQATGCTEPASARVCGGNGDAS